MRTKGDMFTNLCASLERADQERLIASGIARAQDDNSGGGITEWKGSSPRSLQFGHTTTSVRERSALEVLDAASMSSPRSPFKYLESLNDLVERVTGVLVRETVPDTFLKQADQIVTLDLTVEDLNRRRRSCRP